MHMFLEILLLFLTAIYSFLEALVKLFIPVKKKSVRGEVVLVTGAGHGLGRLTAIEFAKLGATLILWDINKNAIEETANECRSLGATVHVHQVDCSKREDIYSTAEKVKNEIGDIGILVNNAGVVVCSKLLSLPDQDIKRMFDVNTLAHFWTIKAFLPAMVKNNHGHLVTVASICGHLSLPQLVTYCSSKFAVVGLHISLTEELTTPGKNGVKTTCLCPVFVDTGFTENPSSRIWPVLKPEYVVKELMNGILTNKKMIFAPSWVRFHVLLDRILPERLLAAVNKLQDPKCNPALPEGNKDK
ncbi:17-beta-hydroxysteroid dehydrogenase 13-like [Ambystoma mexicanum]|uniref:17-beta-hydroxysteroid dehydrogenase 13-like n=1 Tax=Ambystoma mexicanum TaxID=8296 RepID=UPI0037E742CC